MSSFFTIPSSQKKRKRSEVAGPPKKRVASSKSASREPKSQRRPQRDESISGSEDESDEGPRDAFEDAEAGTSSSEEEGAEGEEETAAERRLRLAERYLENIREEVDEVGFDAEEIDRDLIAERLKEDAAESKGRLYRKLASELDFGGARHSWFKSNNETCTSVATCPPYAYTVSKDLCLVKWRIQDLPRDQWAPKSKKKRSKPRPPPKRKPEVVALVRGNGHKAKDNTYQGHTGAILTVAASQDGKFVVTGGKDRKIIVWEAETLKPLRVFTHHRDSVTGLAFRRGTNQLFSSSADRTIKVWSLNELAYVETLFGHQDQVIDIAALAQERCISVGARDRTARLWKVVEESQLVFRGGGGEKKTKSGSAGPPKVLEGSMDRVAMIDEEMFITGGDNGNLSLWVIHKKKPVFTLPLAHGVEPPLAPEEASAEVDPEKRIVPLPQPRWITALATIPYSDVILSGSWDGEVRAWRVSDDKKKIESMGVLASPSAQALSTTAVQINGDSTGGGEPTVRGVINDISVFERGDRGKDGACIVVAVGKEHRMGRWKKVHGKNGAVVFEVPKVEKPETNGVVVAAAPDEE